MNLTALMRNFLSNVLMTAINYKSRKRVYANVKKDTNKVVLTRKQKNEIVKYFSKYENVTWKFHNFYTEKTGRFAVNYIPDDIYFTKVGRYYNDYILGRVTDNKCDYERVFPNILQPELIAYRKAGYWFADGKLITRDEVLEIMKLEGAGFIKVATVSGGGAGVTYVNKDECENFEKRVLEVISRNTKDIIIQKPIIQHKDIGKLNESSVNTMRILTLFRKGEVKVYSSLLRIGKANSKVDNGSVSVGILPDGRLKEVGYYLSGEQFTSHPSSGVVFKDYQLPSYDKAVELVKKAHIFIPQFKLASWDIAIREDGEPVFLEVNVCEGEISFHQLNNGPVFGDDTEEILNEVFGK